MWPLQTSFVNRWGVQLLHQCRWHESFEGLSCSVVIWKYAVHRAGACHAVQKRERSSLTDHRVKG